MTRTPTIVPAPVPIPEYRQRAQLRKPAAAQQFPKATQPVVRPRTAQRPNNLGAQRQQQRDGAMKGRRDAQERAQQMEPQREQQQGLVAQQESTERQRRIDAQRRRQNRRATTPARTSGSTGGTEIAYDADGSAATD